MSISFIGPQLQKLRQKFSHSVGLPIRAALPMEQIEAALEAERMSYRRCVFDPFVTLWAFLSQVLDTDRSCRKALSRVRAYQAELTLRGGPATPLDADTSVYCKYSRPTSW